MDDIEPPSESTTRNGGPLAFGVDGCLYLGVGDNGNNNRWNAQVLIGTDQWSGTENDELCTDVCLGNASWPDRPSDTDGEVNHAGKLLRMAVEGPSIAQPAAAPPLPDQPFMFAGGLRSPTGIAVHPLTGQIYVADRGETQASEIDVIDRASNAGWPCLEGGVVSNSTVASCLTGMLPDVVYGNHPDWRRPVVSQLGNPRRRSRASPPTRASPIRRSSTATCSICCATARASTASTSTRRASCRIRTASRRSSSTTTWRTATSSSTTTSTATTSSRTSR
jgi:hypothetical protein